MVRIADSWTQASEARAIATTPEGGSSLNSGQLEPPRAHQRFSESGLVNGCAHVPFEVEVAGLGGLAGGVVVGVDASTSITWT
jgi:hypothetical protein